MRILICAALLLSASAAGAEPLTYAGLGAATTEADVVDLVQNCQPNPAGETVCWMPRDTFAGLPITGEGVLASFRAGHLFKIDSVLASRFQEVARRFEQLYGRPENVQSNRVLQADGRMATFRTTQWTLDDGQISILTAEIAGEAPSVIVRFNWPQSDF